MKRMTGRSFINGASIGSAPLWAASIAILGLLLPVLVWGQAGVIGNPINGKVEVRHLGTSWDGADVALTCGQATWRVENTEQGDFVTVALSELASFPGELGQPDVPTVRFWLEAPVCDDITLTVSANTREVLPLTFTGANRIMPVQMGFRKTPEPRPFKVDPAAYGYEWYAEPCRIAEEVWLGCHRMLLVEFAPLTYDPIAGTVTLRDDIRVHFTFHGSSAAATQANYSKHPPSREDLALALPAINSPWFAEVLWVDPLPIQYLIVTKSAYVATLQPLITWRNKIGYVTTVATEADIASWTTTGIKAYIQNRYNTVGLDYVVLVGDPSGTNSLPIYTGLATSPAGVPCTDLYYGCVVGTDHTQDIGVGRLSVTTTNQLTTIVNKILNYEQRNIGGTAWLKNDMMIGSSDPTYHGTTEATHRYCTSSIFTPNGWATDTLFPFIRSADNNARVTSEVNAGKVFNIYSGHGAETGYADYDIDFPAASINALTNGNKLCIAVTHACLTNQYTYGSGDCGGESWIHNANGGAVLYWGSTTNTYWSQDDTLQRKWVRDFFNDSTRTMSGLAREGLRKVATVWSSYDLYYWEEYNITGDPSLIPIWLTLDTLHASHAATAPMGSSNVAVTVTSMSGAAVQNALVCAYKSGEVQSIAYTNATGQVTLAVSPTTSGTMYITATKPNFVPYQGTMTISSAPSMVHQSHSISDAAGNNNGHVEPNEPINMPVTLTNSGSVSATNVVGVITCSSPNIVIDDNSANFGNISAGGNAPSQSPHYTWHATVNMAWPETLTFTLNWTSNEASGSTNFTEVIGIAAFPYSTHFDLPYGWTHAALAGTDLWHKETHRFMSPDTAFAYNSGAPNYNYNTGTRNSGVLVSPPIDLTGVSVAVLSYQFWLQTQNTGLRRPEPLPPSDPSATMDVIYNNNFDVGNATAWHSTGDVDWSLTNYRYNSADTSARTYDNTNPYSVDAWMQINGGTAFDFSGYTGVSMSLAYNAKTDTPAPRIVVYASRSAGGAGATWDSVGGVAGTAANFVANGTAWPTITVNLSAYDRAPQVSIAIRSLAGTQIAFYIDDISITGTATPSILDAAYVEITSDGGNTWNNIETLDTTIMTWTQRIFPLTSYVGQIVKVRFRFDTGDATANAFEGWYVDNFAIEASAPTGILCPPMTSAAENCLRCTPNPFEREVRLSGLKPGQTPEVHDILGQLVRRLPPGTTVWDGKDAHGNDVLPGVYRISVGTESVAIVKK